MSDTVAELERELAELKARSAARSSLSGASRPDTFELLDRKKKSEAESREDTVTRLSRELEALREKSATRSERETREDTVTRLEREVEEMKARSAAKKKEETKEDTVARLSRELEAAREKSASRKAESKEDTVSRLSRELEAMKARSATKKAEEREDTVTRLNRELELLREKSTSRKKETKEEEREDTVTRLTRELDLLKEKSAAKTREVERVDTVSKLEAELALLRETSKTREYRSTSSRPDDTVAKLEAELAKLKVDGDTTRAYSRELHSAKKAVDALKGTEVDDTIARLMRERDKLKADIESEGELSAKLTSKRREKEMIMYGIDICFIVDCTGSMSPWINEVKMKVGEVIAETEKYAGNSKCSVRVAFLGYRDYDDNPRFDIVDFIQKDQLESFIVKLASVGAYGGGDGPEDVAGAFNKSLGLSWRASTRVVIHIADAPCHGRKYHNMHDDHPSGDPSYDPLELLEAIKKKKIHFYFVEISQYTKQMTDLFSRVYSNSQFQFDVKHLNSASPSELLPAVIESVKASMSVTFSKDADRIF